MTQDIATVDLAKIRVRRRDHKRHPFTGHGRVPEAMADAFQAPALEQAQHVDSLAAFTPVEPIRRSGGQGTTCGD